MKLLSSRFFERDTVTVARELLGREIVRELRGRGAGKGRERRLRARIVETEAYLQEGDPAAHCSRGPTPRAKIMFGKPAVIYVYFIYGNYFMLNFVTERPGRAGAVLIRAVEPIEGIQTMARLRGGPLGLKNPEGRALRALTNGPGKLVLAMGIDGSLNGKPLGLPHLAVAEGTPVKPEEVVVTTRVGLSVAKEHPLRFYVKGNPFISKS